jgi:DNA invertase Pin-like site-specific DNA recombinase
LVIAELSLFLLGPAVCIAIRAAPTFIYDVVVVYSLDRWSRNLMVTLQTFNALAKNGVAFASVTENID